MTVAPLFPKAGEAPSRNWDALDGDKYRDEEEAVAALLQARTLSADARAGVHRRALKLVQSARAGARRHGMVESFLQEFSLSTPEGLALMGLAEALLRTPDSETRDRLIAENIGPADWQAHLGNSESLFVNASTWALMLTGRIGVLDDLDDSDRAGIFRKLVTRVGEKVVRAAVTEAIRIMGRQFVLGRDIGEALDRAHQEKLLCSFDMLGEGARTAADAARYEAAYAKAIAALAGQDLAPETGHGISVKLSALSPRYEATQEARVWNELYPRLSRLARQAAAANINFTLDAEEADRLVLSLKLLDRLAHEPALAGWQGLGLAVQAYQKRAPQVIAELAGLARDSGRRLMVRLVKGAYWDSEIKRAQISGRPDYPVYTTKAATDVSYLVCARAILSASPHLFGQFATHNAHTLAAIKAMADEAGAAVEFQRLHGMGEALYQAAQQEFGAVSLRTYAPVGAYEDLLPYLVRRLLENGANSSFVHQLLDEATPPEKVVDDPLALLTAMPHRHPRIPKPMELYRDRKNSLGLDLTEASVRAALSSALDAIDSHSLSGHPLIGGSASRGPALLPVTSPFDPERILGHTSETGAPQIERAFALAKEAQPAWDAQGGTGRACVLQAMADALEKQMHRLAALCVREAGKTWPDAIAEVREAADFCRYYALLAERQFGHAQILRGPAGETNSLSLNGRGVFVCISPWNFPLSIFTGQVAAALAAGNAVLAKPAEETPLIAAEAVRLFHQSGLDSRLLHLIPGRGETVGAALVAHPSADGVAFTGGTATAKAINQALAAREGPIIPFIAETGGLNALFADTTAQREQLIDDVILSAFGSAGQRCSALRILFLPGETADDMIAGISGAMDALTVGDPAQFNTDVGPIIDTDARNQLDRALAKLISESHAVRRAPETQSAPLVFAPAMAEITLDRLPDKEVFGPILHVVRYGEKELETACQALAAKGYGLTLGIHSRLDSFVRRVRALVPAGNTYVNRSIIGAVVGVQPFGGEGLSGTGPKAGGPLSLSRYAVERALSINIAAKGGDPALLNL
ncbi:MAG TPA: bifunctional proline dehydrogenase/L-glutamate gamma-semialdehyde dehydrogenase PutA [Rhizomicrobium sp.]|nr:bifunctional proline dehydrogenase/L-glutamate gamma-semialdehyde dehydrogenase PutA [Rhizomicrobium sp.]